METYLTMHPLRFMLIAFAAIALMMVSVFAFASTEPEVSISYEAAELDSAKGQELLYARLEKAARQLCGPTKLSDTGSLEKAQSNAECYDDTLTAAVDRLDNEAIRALHNR